VSSEKLNNQSRGSRAPNITHTPVTASTNSTARKTTPTWQASNMLVRCSFCHGVRFFIARNKAAQQGGFAEVLQVGRQASWCAVFHGLKKTIKVDAGAGGFPVGPAQIKSLGRVLHRSGHSAMG
jgi:hypothetical protein